jgi:PEP-CTERM motif
MQVTFVGPGGGFGGFLAVEGENLVTRMVSTPYPQPEPTTLLLLGSGLIAPLLRRRHR